MKRIELELLPLAKEGESKTRLVVDGSLIASRDNRLTDLVVCQPMRKWLNPYKKKLFVWAGLLPEILEEFNDTAVQFTFCGCKADFTVFQKSILLQQAKLNRNGGAAEVDFAFIEAASPRRTVRETLDILEDLRVEAENGGQEHILSALDALKPLLLTCTVALNTALLPADQAFAQLLQDHGIALCPEETALALLTVIPADGSLPPAELHRVLSALPANPTNAQGADIKFLPGDDEDFLPELIRLYFLTVLPQVSRQLTQLLHSFPNRAENSYLADIADRLDDLFSTGRQ